jgi:hypothetical protein
MIFANKKRYAKMVSTNIKEQGLHTSDTQIAHLAEKLRTIGSEASASPDAKKR